MNRLPTYPLIDKDDKLWKRFPMSNAKVKQFSEKFKSFDYFNHQRHIEP